MKRMKLIQMNNKMLNDSVIWDLSDRDDENLGRT